MFIKHLSENMPSVLGPTRVVRRRKTEQRLSLLYT